MSSNANNAMNVEDDESTHVRQIHLPTFIISVPIFETLHDALDNFTDKTTLEGIPAYDVRHQS